MAAALPTSYEAIGYTGDKNSFPLVAFPRDIPVPRSDELLIKVIGSSLNPLEFKLADLNFFGNTPPVALGFDVSGTVVAVGKDVKDYAVGDSVVAMSDCNGHGGWATGGSGGYAVAREYLSAKKPEAVSFADAGALPVCFLAAYLGLFEHVRPGDTVYIPGGAGGVGHLAIQIAAKALGALRVISSGSSDRSKDLILRCGAHTVLDYKQEDTTQRVLELTDGRGADVVFDPTYSEQSYVGSAKAVRHGGKWVVLGVGPGRTSRTQITESPVDAILAEKNAKHINANVLNYFLGTRVIEGATKDFLRGAMAASMRWHVKDLVRPVISEEIVSSVEAINAGLSKLRQASGVHGKIAVNLSHS